MDNNEIKKYIVKITYNKKLGSGVIFPISSTKEFFYIFTAKHTFFKEEMNIEDMKVEEIEDCINMQNPEIGNIIVKKDDIQSNINKEYDLLIFRISTELNQKIKKLRPISVFSDNFKSCTIMGYPKIRDKKDTQFDTFLCTYKQENKKSYLFEMDSNKKLSSFKDSDGNPNSNIAGVSGSGVFVKGSTEKLYLVGIQIQSATLDSIIAIDLRKIFDELNEKLDNTLTLGGYQFFEEIGLDIKKLEFDDLMDKLNNDKELQDIKNHNTFDSEIDFIEQPTYRDRMNSKYKKLQEDRKELSDTFLYQGIVFHKNGKNQQATNRFKKAITLYPDYKHYFAKAKFERDKITKEQREAKERIDKESAFSDNIEMAIETLRSDIEKYKADENSKSLIETYRQIISLLSIKYDDNESEIINFSKELAKVLISNNKFIEAENILLNIEDDEVSSNLYKIYTNEEFSKNSCLNKKQFSNKLIDLLGRLDRESIEYQDIKTKLEELNIFDNQMIEFHEKFVSLERKYESTVAKLTQDIQLLSTHVSDKTLLNKINYRVFNTDKKLDTVSQNILTKIDTSTNKITKKLDEVKITIIKTNSQELNNFLDNVYRSNQSLVSKIQTMYHQNDRASKQAFIILNNSIKSMNEKIEECLNRAVPEGKSTSKDSNNNQVDIEKIIKDSNWNFYNAIQGLYEKDSDSYNRKLLEMSIAFTKREHELHIENLKESHKNEILEIDKRYQEEVITLKEKMKNLVDTLKGITLKYQDSENISMKKNKELIFLKEEYNELEKSFENDSKTNLTEKAKQRFQEKIKVLTIKIVKLENDLLLKEKDVELKESEFKRELSSIKLTKSETNLKESLELSNKTSWNLLKLDDRYEEKIKELEYKLNEIKFNSKNKKRFRKYLRKILNFEKKLDEIKRRGDVYPVKVDPNITLHLLEKDLEKIDKIISKRQSKLYASYCITRNIIIGVIAMTILLLYEPFWRYIIDYFHF